MWAYIVRRILLTIPTVLGVLLLTFILFGVVAKDPARAWAGKHPSPATLSALRAKMGLDKPRFINRQHPMNTQFFDLLLFRFPQSMRHEESIWKLIAEKGPVSLAIQLPAFLITIGLQLLIALYVAYCRGKPVDYAVTLFTVLALSIPTLSIYLFFQWFLGGKLGWFPVAGWPGGNNNITWFASIQFAALPILVSVVVGVGGGVRIYRTVVLDEINADYIRTARAKGISRPEIMLTHVLRNVLIPVITMTVTGLPFLLFGALILERIYQIPGLGNLLVDSIYSHDSAVVMAITYITALVYCIMLLISDILYMVADPRVTLT